MASKNDTLKYRVRQLEKKVDGLDKKVDAILMNHFPSLDKKVERLSTKMTAVTAVNVGAIILGLLLARLL